MEFPPSLTNTALNIRRLRRVGQQCAILLVALAMSGCASTKSAGVMPGQQSTHVASVEVVPVGPAISTEFAGQLHDAVIKGAALYGDVGEPITIKIDLDKVHFKSRLKAMFVGDNSYIKGHVSVVDQTSGEQMGTFAVAVDAEKPGASSAGFGMFLLESVDPTGAVGVGHMAEKVATGSTTRDSVAAGLCANFAAETLRQTFGDAKTKAAKSGKRN